MMTISFIDSNYAIPLVRGSLITDATGDTHAMLTVRDAIPVAGERVIVSLPNGVSIWMGYVATIEQAGAETTIGTVGLAQRLRDVRYTAFWSDTRFGEWDIPPPTAWSDWLQQAWQHDTNNRLYATTRPGETYGGAVGNRRAMAWAYRVPNLSLTGIGWATVTVTLAGGLWYAAITSYTAIAETSPWTQGSTTLMPSSGTYTLTTSSAPAYVIRTIPPSSPVVETNPVNTRTITATAVRVAVHAPPVTATEIVAHALAHAQAHLGSSVLSGWQVSSSTADVEIAVWEDATVRDIVDWSAAQLGAEWWIDRNSQSVMISATRPRRQWTARGEAIAITSGNNQIATRCYARYRNPSGTRILRTATATNATAEQQYRLSRTVVIDVDTTSETVANAVRDAYLAQASAQPPTATLVARQRGDLYGATGPAEPWEAEPGDEVVMLGAPPLVIARRTVTPEQTTYELTAPAGTLISALAR
jgi:hypothetical protein